MKHLASVLIAVLLLCTCCAFAFEENPASPLSAKMRVSVSYSTNGYNSVGNNWSSYFSANKKQLNNSAILVLTEDTELELYAQFKENDKKPDLGYHTETLLIDKQLFEEDKAVSFKINVYENSGRYSGNCCTWNVTFTFQFIDWADSSTGVPVTVTANTVALTEESGNIIYIKNGAELIVTGYLPDKDRFTADFENTTGLIKGIGLSYSKEELISMFII